MISGHFLLQHLIDKVKNSTSKKKMTQEKNIVTSILIIMSVLFFCYYDYMIEYTLLSKVLFHLLEMTMSKN